MVARVTGILNALNCIMSLMVPNRIHPCVPDEMTITHFSSSQPFGTLNVHIWGGTLVIPLTPMNIVTSILFNLLTTRNV